MLGVIGPRPYKKAARALGEQRTREALLDAADEEFYEGRWRKTSLEKLAAKAGVTKQTLLRHFESKEGLLLQALVRGYSDVHDQRWSAPAGDLEGTVENLLDHYEDWGKRSLLIGRWLEEGNPLLAKLSQAARQVHYEWVEHAFAPWLTPLAPGIRRRRRDALIAICDVHTWWLLSHDLGLDRAAVRATLTDAIEGIVREA
ncbi:MAG TPA: TetR/AcrR family transcriptional regulator [Solirubrobacteraceae bacterium]|nr:TetR/AcrR family transcriptional regulator [Solirubrobacteraceae bacterium]